MAWLLHLFCHYRNQIAQQVLGDAIEALRSSVDIAVFDAANCTKRRRKWIVDTVRETDLYAQASTKIGRSLHHSALLSRVADWWYHPREGKVLKS